MAEIHSIIRQHGIAEARRQAITRQERAQVEAAYQVLAEESEAIGFTYSGFALTSLPHKQPDSTIWKREGHNLTLVLQSGVDRQGKEVGLPFGSYARFILLFLQSEAVRSQSREIELGRSMQVWLGKMGLSIGGNSYRLVKEQARRISVCKLTFFGGFSDKEILRNGGFVEGAITMHGSFDQPMLWNDRVRLDEGFYRALCDHPVPVSETALRAIGPRFMRSLEPDSNAFAPSVRNSSTHWGWPWRPILMHMSQPGTRGLCYIRRGRPLPGHSATKVQLMLGFSLGLWWRKG